MFLTSLKSFQEFDADMPEVEPAGRVSRLGVEINNPLYDEINRPHSRPQSVASTPRDPSTYEVINVTPRYESPSYRGFDSPSYGGKLPPLTTPSSADEAELQDDTDSVAEMKVGCMYLKIMITLVYYYILNLSNVLFCLKNKVTQTHF